MKELGVYVASVACPVTASYAENASGWWQPRGLQKMGSGVGGACAERGTRLCNLLDNSGSPCREPLTQQRTHVWGLLFDAHAPEAVFSQ